MNIVPGSSLGTFGAPSFGSGDLSDQPPKIAARQRSSAVKTPHLLAAMGGSVQELRQPLESLHPNYGQNPQLHFRRTPSCELLAIVSLPSYIRSRVYGFTGLGFRAMASA